MKKKPLIFILLAFAHFLEPLIKILYFKATTTFSFSTILGNIMQIEAPREIFDFWLLFPLAGLALLSVKKWSYPIFVGVQAYSIYSHLTYEKYTWPYVSETPFISSLSLLVMNVLIICYFSLPDVRKPFFDQSVRWWETRKRYGLNIPISFSLTKDNAIYNSDILNISQSGVFLSDHQSVNIGSVIKMNLIYKGLSLHVKGKVKSHHSFENIPGVGVKFIFENIWENLYMRKILRQIAKDMKSEDKRVDINQQVFSTTDNH